jgi:hypothetical protein
MSEQGRLTIAVDLDGTLAHYDGWKGQREIGAPLPGAREALEQLVAAGHRVMVYTCRCGDWQRETWGDGLSRDESAAIVKAWLDEHGFHGSVEVYTGDGKPLADYYVDDRAIVCRPQDAGERAWQTALFIIGLDVSAGEKHLRSEG